MRKPLFLLPLLFSIIFVYLFNQKQSGFNILIFNVLLLGIMYFYKRIDLKIRFHVYVVTGLLLSGISVVLFGAGVGLFANILSLLILSGVAAYPGLVVPLNVALASASAAISGPFNWLKEVLSVPESGSGAAKLLRKTGLIAIPVLILGVFILLYSASSPYFNRITGDLLKNFNQFFKFLSSWISPEAFWMGIAAILMFFVYLFGSYNNNLNVFDETRGEMMRRIRKPFSGRSTVLKSEYKSGITLLILLNLTLLVMNVLDIYHVWLFFEWDGGYLRQFVHEGTWLLIVSVAISMGIVIWYFRGNLNFYSQNRLLIKLSVIWLIQNALLVISVAIRNLWYIHYFNLAYKRIWVFGFLLLVLLGIFTVFVKLTKRKSLQYLLVRNSLFAYAIIVLLGLFHWDRIIAKFNVKRSDKAFFHTDFMMGLNSSTLPVLHLTAGQLEKINSVSHNAFPDTDLYATTSQFEDRIRQRSRDFIAGYPLLGWQGKNVAEIRAYHALKKKNQSGTE